MAKQKDAVKKQAKKKSRKPARKQASKQPRGIRRWFRDTRGELRKVEWPTRNEAISLTWIVVIVMALMALVLGGLDFGFYQFFELIWNL